MENIRELFQVMTRRFGLLNKNCCLVGNVDISLVQSHILYEIYRQNKPSMQQVAEVLSIDITTFSRQIQTLIKKKLVKKTPLSEDRRVSVLSLTPEGLQVTEAIDNNINQQLEAIFLNMTEYEKKMVLQSIKLLNDSMAKTTMCCRALY